MATHHCPFCHIRAEQIIDQDEWVFVIRDGFPVARGHTLIIPNRHIESYFETTKAERRSMDEMLFKHRGELALQYSTDSFNIGINDGPMAGQTMKHIHLHIIPRHSDDMPDPRGGIRFVIPDKAKYWP